MYRTAILFLALTFSPAVVAAQQPCTTDARQVVNELYRHMLERGADAGSAHWAQQLESGRMTVRELVRQIAKSEEHTQRFWRQEAGEEAPYVRAAGAIYRHILGRQPDAPGARSWADQGARRGVSAIIDQIVGSREYDNQFGDWGVPGSGGIRYCAPNNRTASQETVAPVAPVNQGRFRGMDRNNDGIISRAEWRGNNQSFENQDWNNDGVLSGDEVDGGAARFGRMADNRDFGRGAERFEVLDANNNERIEPREWDGNVAAFNRLDVNNDNVLSRAEMVNAGVADTPAVATRRAERYDTLDVNNNGRIEPREWDGTVAAFNRLDVNNDNFLSRAEMVGSGGADTAAVATRRAERYDTLDVNNNGRIEPREWDGTVAAFNQLDVNNDNFLSRAEMVGSGFDDTAAVGTSGQVIRVEGAQLWTDTFINVRAGDMLLFDAQGTVRLSDNGNDIAGVGGTLSGRRAADAPFVNQPAGALIARIGTSGTFFVGNRRSVRAPTTGRLYLGVNDDYLGDNSGDFQVMVTVQRN